MRVARRLRRSPIVKFDVLVVAVGPSVPRTRGIKPISGKGAKMTRQKLSSKEKTRILKMRASGESVVSVAKRVGRNRGTIRKFLDEPKSKELLADMCERRGREILAAVSAEDIARATLQQKLVSAAIAIDKMQLLRGNPTSINVSLMLEAVEVLIELRDGKRSVASSGAPTSAMSIDVSPQPANPAVQSARAIAAHGQPEMQATVRYVPVGPDLPPEPSPLVRGLRQW